MSTSRLTLGELIPGHIERLGHRELTELGSLQQLQGTGERVVIVFDVKRRDRGHFGPEIDGVAVCSAVGCYLLPAAPAKEQS
jgi:hypothetical protein